MSNKFTPAAVRFGLAQAAKTLRTARLAPFWNYNDRARLGDMADMLDTLVRRCDGPYTRLERERDTEVVRKSRAVVDHG